MLIDLISEQKLISADFIELRWLALLNAWCDLSLDTDNVRLFLEENGYISKRNKI